jgi:hypothetical protein
LEEAGLDYPEFYITEEWEGSLESALAWGRRMCCNPAMQLLISVEYNPTEYGQPVDALFEERAEIISPVARRFIAFFEDSAEDICMAVQLLFAPEYDDLSGVYFLYAPDHRTITSDFITVVTPDSTHGVQWQFLAVDDPVDAPPHDFYLMDQQWTWMPTPMPLLLED